MARIDFTAAVDQEWSYFERVPRCASIELASIADEAAGREPAQLSPRLVELNGSLLGVGSHVPARVVSNQCLIEGRSLDTTAEWIESRTGIRERRFAEATDSLSSMAAQAARQALQQASVAPEDLTLIVVATSTSDYKMPTSASDLLSAIGRSSMLRP